MTEAVEIQGPHGEISYRDTRDHFDNGVLRLLGMDQAAFEHWIALAEQEPHPDVLDRLKHAFAQLSPMARTATLHAADVEPGPGGESGSLWHPSIAENRDYGVAISDDGDLAWLIELGGDVWHRVLVPPEYEEAYFEGGSEAGGYSSYGAESWRMEKAERQVREIAEASGVRAGRALDLGSGYGFFRKALESAGFEHEGVEISEHARQAAKQLFGLETVGGTLSEHASGWAGRFDLVTLWDVIEHVSDPRALLGEVASVLAPGGVVALKTPNIRCPEARVFGPHYHSLKREHLVYFSDRSLQRTAQAAGLSTVSLTSISHLLTGFIGEERAKRYVAAGEGADLLGYFRRDAA